MLLKPIFTLLTLIAAAANNQVLVVFQPNEDQLRAMNTKEGNLRVRGDLMQPLSDQKIKELEAATGVTLFDKSPVGLGGRVLRTEHDLSASETKKLLDKLNEVSWIKYATENTPTYSGPMPTETQTQLIKSGESCSNFPFFKTSADSCDSGISATRQTNKRPSPI